MPVDDVAELLRRWREAGGAWSRGRVLLDAAQLAGRLTPEERRTVAAALADTGAPDLARQLESRTGQPVDGAHLQAFADGLLELEGARLDQVITALQVADARLIDAGPDEAAAGDGQPEEAATHHAEPDALPPPPPGHRGAVTPQDEALDERLRDLAALEHLGDEELRGIRLGEIELGAPELGGQELGQADLGEVGLGEVGLGEVTLGATAGIATAAATGPRVDLEAPDDGTPTDRETPEATPAAEPEATPAAEPTTATEPEATATEPEATPAEPATTAETGGGAVASRPGDAALVPAADAPDDLTPKTTADALATLSGRLTGARTAAARFAALAPDVTRDLDAPAALLALDQVPAGWQRRRAAQRLFAVGALAGVDATALLARFPDARDRRFVAADLLAASELAAEDLADDLPPQVVRRLAIRAER